MDFKEMILFLSRLFLMQSILLCIVAVILL